jgi:flagellar biosynthetic protein FlhB
LPLEDRTEPASPQHRQEARKKGQVAKSTEMTSAAVLLVALMVGKAAAPMMMGQLATMVRHFLGNLSTFQPTPEGTRALFIEASFAGFKTLAPILSGIFVTAVAVNLAQVGFMVTVQPMAPDLTRIDPITGMARMFSVRALVELLKSLAKVTVLGCVVWVFLRDQAPTVASLGTYAPDEAGRIVGDLIFSLCMRVCSVLLVIASIDYIYQRMQFEKSIRMTKQEVKEEFKRSEGDPQVKAAVRQRQREMARRRMMQDVATADVVVTNPTHYAVALKYDGTKMAAPVVVAKGQRLVAQRIKAIAVEHHIPMVENKAVARALFASAEIGDPVPVELYQAVAEILAFVYRLRHGMK